MGNKLKVRGGSSATRPILDAREFGFSTDTKQLHIGDGVKNHELARMSNVMLPEDIFSPWVVAGLTATVTGTNANVTIAAGTAYNTQRLHTTGDTVLVVTNTGTAHTEYVSVDVSGALIITTAARTLDLLSVADVNVDAFGVATAVTDTRNMVMRLKTPGGGSMIPGRFLETRITFQRRARVTGVDWDNTRSVAWSPDGKYLAMASHFADAVEVAEFTGTALVRKARVTGADWSGAINVSWSPDGKYLAMASVNADAVEVAEFTGTALIRKARVAGVDWDGVWSVAWSPDGKYLAMASVNADAVEVVS